MNAGSTTDPPRRVQPLPVSGGRAPGVGTTLADGLWRRNPLAVQLLGVCSALAVTGQLETALVMSVAVIFVCAASGLAISCVGPVTPGRIRLIAWILLIGTFVIVADEICKAFFWEISLQLGPYVGLIITNCIILGRAEAFASKHKAPIALLDGLANGLGYAVVLCAVAVVRELFGTGEVVLRNLLPREVVLLRLGEWYPPNDILLMAGGAFMVMGLLVAAFNRLTGRRDSHA